MVKKYSLLIVLLTVLLLPGCWNKREIESLAIISAIGVDYTEIDGQPKWQVTLEIYHPETLSPSGGDVTAGGGGGGAKPASWIVTSIGDTVGEAINNFSSRTPRVLFFSHARIIVIGQRAVEKFNLEDVLSIFFNRHESRLRNWVLIADGKAQNVLLAGPELEPTRSVELEEMILQTRKRLSKTEVLNLRDVGEALASPGKDVITGRVEVFRTPEPPPAELQGGQGAERSSIRLHGAGVFSQGKFAGWLSDLETRGYLFIMGKAKSSVVPIQLDDNPFFDTNIRIIKASSKITPELKDGEINFKIAIQAEGHLEELFPGNYKVTPELFEQIGNRVAVELREEALKAITKAKDYRADIFGFGELVHRRYPRYWKQVEENWRDYFVTLPVEVEVDVLIRRTGIFEEPVPSR